MSKNDSPDHVEEMIDQNKAALLNTELPLSVRVKCGLTLVAIITVKECARTGTAPKPTRNREISKAWMAMHEPMLQLAALAESRNIDSTKLLKLHSSRLHTDVRDCLQLLDRLEIVECGSKAIDYQCGPGTFPTTTPVDRPTKSDLVASARISNTSMDRIRKNAGIESKIGGAGATKRYSTHEVDLLISEVLNGPYQRRREIATCWQKWSGNPAS